MRVVPAAVKLDSAQIVPTLADPRMPYERLVLLDPGQPFTPAPVADSGLPAPSPSRATLVHWEPGRMSIVLDPVPAAQSYVLVAENWYTDWHASVDGAPAPVLRGDWTLLTVPVPAHATRIELAFTSRRYHWGQVVTLLSLALVLGGLAGPAAARRRRRA